MGANEKLNQKMPFSIIDGKVIWNEEKAKEMCNTQEFKDFEKRIKSEYLANNGNENSSYLDSEKKELEDIIQKLKQSK